MSSSRYLQRIIIAKNKNPVYSMVILNRARYSLVTKLAVTLVITLLFTASHSFAQQSTQQSTQQSSQQQAVGTDTCLLCHGQGGVFPVDEVLNSPHGVGANPRSPFSPAHQGCETCHGASPQHLSSDASGQRNRPTMVFNTKAFDENHAAADKNAVCLNCHRAEIDQHWAGSVHQFEELACSDCHTIHVAKDPILITKTQPEVCFSCHRQQRAELSRPSAHPVITGSLACTDCHNPHGSPGPTLLKSSTINDTCYSCHAEKRGPLLWEHAPVAEDCTNCHMPHGSNHASLLKVRPPWLCQECHQAQFHPSTALSGDNIPPNGASQLVLGRSCLNCHSQVHGSNHPSGARLIR